jgi:crotonobetainyl-CoA:carnitine CoA-transferase CaiB-like acyl-CoA transferase
MAGSLEGVRILDLSTVLLGPWAGQTLGDMGADVIKVETPEGDLMRQLGPRVSDDMGSVHLGLNRNKRSIVIDLKHARGREVLLRLAATADVVMHNLRPSVAARLGVEYDDIRTANANIIYCAACGFRSGGPYQDKPAYDDVIQGASGLAHLQSSISGEPRYVPSAAANHSRCPCSRPW